MFRTLNIYPKLIRSLLPLEEEKEWHLNTVCVSKKVLWLGNEAWLKVNIFKRAIECLG